MADFSSVYPQLNHQVRAILERVQLPSAGRLNELLEKSAGERLELPELAELLEIGAADNDQGVFEHLRASVVSRWRKESGNRLRYVAPIYVSSFCVDQCAYCNFAATRTATVRKRLTLDELRQEIEAVMANGARVIELVYATDLEFTTEMLASYVGATVEALKGHEGAGALLCTEYLTREDYRVLREAGLDGIVQWDETLDEAAYRHWHDSSPHKRAFQTRMDNHDRALAAGLGVATGVLFGLTDYRYDALMQIAKARHFQSEYGKAPFAFGSARLKPIGGHELRLRTSTSDRAWEAALMVYQLAAPEAGRWLQTRENFEMNLRNLLNNDVFTYRCGDVTPGGYHQIANGQVVRRGQFGVNELLSREYVEAALAARNFRIDYAWM
jgi:2-iminoacetate synthase